MCYVVSAKLADEMPASTAPFARSFVDSKASQQFGGGKRFLDVIASDYDDLVKRYPNAVVKV